MKIPEINPHTKNKLFKPLIKLKSFFGVGVNLNKYQLFTLFVIFWLGLAGLGLVLALLGIFYNVLLAAYIILGGTALIYLVSFNKTRFEINHRFFLIFILILVAIFLFSYYTTPTIFSGRDQGSLSEAAIQLAQNHHFGFSFPAVQQFFNIYGPGKALNFPGFNYTPSGQLFPQFPLGYITWLAVFYSIFGLNGFIVANALTFFIFALSFYLLARYYLRASSAIVAILLILTSFIFSWFFKFTLSENMALAFTWFGIYEFILFTKNKERFYLLASLFSFTILVFARVEALAFLAVIIAILLFRYKDWKYLLTVIIGKKVLIAAGGIIIFYFFNLAVDSQSYTAMLKNILSPFISLGKGISSDTSPLDSPLYVLEILMAYALFNFILFGLVGFIYLLKHKKFEIVLPFLIVLPTFFYVIHPSISPDHPWMLRRFVFSVIPISILYTVWFFDWFFKKRFYFYAFSSLLAAASLIVFMPYVTLNPYKNLLPQIKDISSNFGSSDLVLVDQNATGDGWAMMTGPLNFLYGKQAVYFFNPADLGKLDLKKFDSVYFIIPDSNIDFYRKSGLFSRFVFVKYYKIEYPTLALPDQENWKFLRSSIELPKRETNTIYGKIYLLKNFQ